MDGAAIAQTAPMTYKSNSGPATRNRRLAVALFAILGASLLCTTPSFAQSITTGDITGTVTDPTGAVIPGASLTLTNTQTNTSKQVTTGADGTYRFAFVNPGTYKLVISAKGFRNQERDSVGVAAGQPTPVNAQLALASGAQTVDVVESVSAIQTENADVGTNVDARMLADLPNPGGDLTYYAQTMPGVTMNTQSGYGNFSAQGMPGISNLFSVNGMNFNDPFLSLNNSGASNLMLGSNDIVEANVINNAYSGQYGQYAGTQVTYISRSGSNQFHGDALYNWNGRAVNANQFFNAGNPTPFNNFNQGEAYVSGPIWKNHTFFDVDYELLRNLLPSNAVLNLIPSPQFQAATLANLAAIGDSAEIPFYKQVFGVYNAGAGRATPTPDGGCSGNAFAGLAAGVPCAMEFRSTPTALNHEYLYNIRVDHQFGEKDRGYIRVGRDNGLQPTYTSPFGSTFNASSNQPQMSAQVNEVHTFSPTMVNNLSGSVLYYSAIFAPSNPTAAQAALPTFLNFTDGAFQTIGTNGEPGNFFFPQGRRVFQYQFLDDFSKVWGRHTFRLGYSWLHQTVSDLDFSGFNPIFGELNTNLVDFFNGGGGAGTTSSLNQAFPSSSENAIRFNTNGGYVADDWKVTDRLTVSANLRMESYANPTCDQNCFSRLATQFNGSAVPNALTTPYNQMILSGQHNAYAHVQTVIWEPRIGVALRPFNNDKTVIRSGFGVFADSLPGGLAENAGFNQPGYLFLQGVAAPTLAPGAPGNPFASAAATNAALQTAFKSGGTFNSISAAVPGFGAPNFFGFPNTFKTPHYYKWNLQVEQTLPWKLLLSVNYAGMHGYDLPIDDGGLNAFCPGGAGSVCPTGFAGLPTAAPNPALSVVQQYLNAGVASYNGLITSVQRRLSDGLSFTINYTFSHSLDDLSNGGIANEPYGLVATNASITFPQNPFNIRSNYGNSDYDVRNYFSANIVQTDLIRHLGFKKGSNQIFGGWTISGNIFAHTGLPFTPVDGIAGGALFSQNYVGTIFASQTTPILNTKCGAGAVDSPCLSKSQFAPSFATSGALTGFGTVGRNSFRGPDFVDVDMSIMKDIRIKERATFTFGAQFYNLFNHPNFDNPVADISNPLFGSVVNVVSTPTSLLGSFLGAGGSPRFIEFKGKFSF